MDAPQPCPQPDFVADGVFVIRVATEGGQQRDQARIQVRLALTQALSEMLCVPASAIGIQSTPGEQPCIVIDGGAPGPDGAASARIGCSFSHEAGLSLAAVNLRGAVGVDILRVADIPDCQQVAYDYLGPDVATGLLALPAHARPRAFAQAWTEHEARLKCEGRQLAEWAQRDQSAAPGKGRCQISSLTGLPDDLAGAIAW